MCPSADGQIQTFCHAGGIAKLRCELMFQRHARLFRLRSGRKSLAIALARYSGPPIGNVPQAGFFCRAYETLRQQRRTSFLACFCGHGLSAMGTAAHRFFHAKIRPKAAFKKGENASDLDNEPKRQVWTFFFLCPGDSFGGSFPHSPSRDGPE
jgi:hypothetical protein